MLPIIVVVSVNLTCGDPSTPTTTTASSILNQGGLSTSQLYARCTIYYETVTLYDQIVNKINDVVNNGNFTSTLRQYAKLYSEAGLSAVVISSIPVVLSPKPAPPSKSPSLSVEVTSSASSANLTSFNTTLLVIIVGSIILTLLVAIAVYYVYILSLRDKAARNLQALQDKIVSSQPKAKQQPKRFDFESYLNQLIGAKTEGEQAEIIVAQRKKREQKRGSLKALHGQQVSNLLQKVNKIIGIGQDSSGGEHVVDIDTAADTGGPAQSIPIIGMATTDSIWSYESAFPDSNKHNKDVITSLGAVDIRTRKSLTRFSETVAAERRSSAVSAVMENADAMTSYENAYSGPGDNDVNESVTEFSLDSSVRKSLQRYSATTASDPPMHSAVDIARLALLRSDSDFQSSPTSHTAASAAATISTSSDMPEFDELAVKQRINEVLDLFGQDD